MRNEIVFNGYKVVLPLPVDQRLEFRGLIIVLVGDENISAIDALKCVYAIGQNGKILWQIQEAAAGVPGRARSWFRIYEQDGQLWADNMAGFHCRIDENTGRILESIPDFHM